MSSLAGHDPACSFTCCVKGRCQCPIPALCSVLYALDFRDKLGPAGIKLVLASGTGCVLFLWQGTFFWISDRDDPLDPMILFSGQKLDDPCNTKLMFGKILW